MSSSHLANDADLSGGASDEELSPPPSDNFPSLSFLSLSPSLSLLGEAVLLPLLEELDPPPSERLAASIAFESSSDTDALESPFLLLFPEPLPHFLRVATQPFIGSP